MSLWRLALSCLIVAMLSMAPARAHEVFPAIADMTEADGALTFVVSLNAEALVAGINLDGLVNTNTAPEAPEYDRLRALSPDDLAIAVAAFWPRMAAQITLRVDGRALMPELVSVAVPEAGDVELARDTVLTFRATLPNGARTAQVGWVASYGGLVLRQQGVEAPYDGYLTGGALTPPITLSGGDQAGPWHTLLNYIPIGFDHIVPKGLDHILFVLGLFFLSAQVRPLLWQVSAFTLAHTITLALASLGYVTISPRIVEPLIAASIVLIAVENLFTDGLSRWRPFVVFGFGLLHGLGFASILTEVGLPGGGFWPALIGFNIGVELGQLAVIAVAYGLTVYWVGDRPWYRRTVAVPASLAIAAVGAFWFVERTLL